MKSSLVTVNGQPIRKTKSFCPNPVVQFGIPDCADSYSNAAVIGTTLWKDWWTEQFDYCINGYETGGMWIPGRYYYYLNFFNVSTVGKGNHAPMYVDLDYEFFLMVEEAKRTNKGIISIKARRKGLSYKVVGGIFDYGFRFGRNYQAGICAGLQTHADGFFTKFKNQEALVPPELRLHKLQNNDDIIVAGYTEKTDTGWLHGGMKNTVFCKTMFSSANVFKGEMLDDCVFEEGGEFEMLQEGYEATKPCFMVGDDMEGTPYIYGCVCAGTKVWTNDGSLVNIEDLDVSKGILGYDGDNGLISREEITHWKPPAEKECYRITTISGRTLECSHDHPILWSKKGFCKTKELPRIDGKRQRQRFKSSKFVEAESISIGDQIAVVNDVPIYGDLVMWEPRLVGWLIGYSYYRVNGVPRLSGCDAEINNYVLKNFNTSIGARHLTKEGKVYEEISIKGIQEQLRILGIFGQTKQEKRLPLNHHSYRKRDICELLGGFFDTDGHVNEFRGGYRITLTSAVNELLSEVQLLLQKLGIHSSIYTIKCSERDRKIKDANEYYRLEIRTIEGICQFRDLISFNIAYKQRKLDFIADECESKVPRHASHLTGLRFESVKSVESIGMKPIYNLTAGTTHTYIANGIITHNTGGNMMKGSKGFSEMWAESESYNLMRFWVSAKKLYFPCVAGSLDRKLKINEDIPNLKAKFPEPYMRIGMQDEKQAEFRILERRKLQEKKVNKKPYYDDIQNYPLNTKEAFLTFSSNNYNSVLLNEMQLELMNNEDRFGTYVLEYKKDTNGVPITPLEVFARPAVLDQTKPNRDAPESCVKIHFKGFPMPQYRNLDVAGLDGYDIDLSQTSKSLGAMLVYRRKIEDSSIPGNMPVCMYYDRPKKKELFYELCFKIAVFYNLIENVMCDAGSPLVIDYFEKNGGVKYLAKRPKELESDGSTQQHKWGMKFTTFSRPVIESLVQSDIEDNVHKWVFPEMVGDCNSYQEGNKDNDNDVHDALGLAKARVVDMKARPINIKERQENDPTMIVERYISPEGHVMTREVKAANNPASNVQGDLFMQMLEQGRIG